MLTLGSTALTNILYYAKIRKARDEKEKFQLLYSWLACLLGVPKLWR